MRIEKRERKKKGKGYIYRQTNEQSFSLSLSLFLGFVYREREGEREKKRTSSKVQKAQSSSRGTSNLHSQLLGRGLYPIHQSQTRAVSKRAILVLQEKKRIVRMRSVVFSLSSFLALVEWARLTIYSGDPSNSSRRKDMPA